MTKKEMQIVKNCNERIKFLASLENASFSIDNVQDEKIKRAVRPYMMWFEIVSDCLDSLIELQDSEEESYFKKQDMKRILSDSYRL